MNKNLQQMDVSIKDKESRDDFREIHDRLHEVHMRVSQIMDKRMTPEGNIKDNLQDGFEWQMLHAIMQSVGTASTIAYEVGNLSGKYGKDGD